MNALVLFQKLFENAFRDTEPYIFYMEDVVVFHGSRNNITITDLIFETDRKKRNLYQTCELCLGHVKVYFFDIVM